MKSWASRATPGRGVRSGRMARSVAQVSPAVVRLPSLPAIDAPHVSVLGPVEAAGNCGLVRSAQAVELLAYLATHPRGAGRDSVVTALWPDRAPTGATFNNLVSAARAQLGGGTEAGAELLPRAVRGGPYKLSPTVVCDLAAFEGLVATDGLDQPAEMQRLADALGLVRGRPFGAESGFEWAFSQGLVAHAERRIAEAAHRLCQLALEAGDTATASWATAQGMLACPEDEVLARDAMAAAHAAGNPAGVEATLDRLAAQLEPGEDVFEVLHPDTIAEYRRLGHRRRGRSREIGAGRVANRRRASA